MATSQPVQFHHTRGILTVTQAMQTILTPVQNPHNLIETAVGNVAGIVAETVAYPGAGTGVVALWHVPGEIKQKSIEN